MNLLAFEYDQIEKLYAACHPTWPKRPREWYEAICNFVIHEKGRIVAWAALTLSPPPTFDLANRLGPKGLAAWLVDTCVAESERGRGLAGVLMDQRLDKAYYAGAQMALGACAESNEPMLRLLESRGFKFVCDTPNAFPDGSKGKTFIKMLHRG